MSYESKTVPELKKLLVEAGVEFAATAKKPELVALADANLPALVEEPAPALGNEAKQDEDTQADASSVAVAAPKKGKGCNPSHQEQRAAVGAGHLVCPDCKEVVPQEFGVTVGGKKVAQCPEDHEAMRGAVGVGHLVCKSCGQEVPQTF